MVNFNFRSFYLLENVSVSPFVLFLRRTSYINMTAKTLPETVAVGAVFGGLQYYDRQAAGTLDFPD